MLATRKRKAKLQQPGRDWYRVFYKREASLGATRIGVQRLLVARRLE